MANKLNFKKKQTIKIILSTTVYNVISILFVNNFYGVILLIKLK
jgi:hypothetical protein